MAEESSAAFKAEMKDAATGFVHDFVLSFYERDKSVSLYDTKNKRMFLKRSIPTETIDFGALYAGASVTVFARSLTVVGYADEKTKRRFTTTRGAGLLLVKPDAYAQMGQILDAVYACPGLSVGRLRIVRFSAAEATSFVGLGSSATSPRSLVGDACLAIEITGEDIIARLHQLAGPQDPADAKEAAPASLRAVFGGDSKSENAVHVSGGIEDAKLELGHIFDRHYPYTSVATHCAALIVKPHAVESKLTGKILDTVLACGLEVSALRSIAMTRNDAADFLECYRTVVSEFERWVKELSSGACVVLEVRADGGAAVDTLRELCGPYDPVIAKALRPESLRALYGEDTVRNALHCTDVDRDGPLECKFLFNVV